MRVNLAIYTREFSELVKKTLLLVLTFVLPGFVASDCSAYEVDFIGDKVQGGLVIGKVAPGIKVSFKNKYIRVSEQGYFLLGFDRDEAQTVDYVLEYPDSSSQTKSIQIAQRNYKEEFITGLAANKVEPSQADLDRISREQAYFDNARQIDDTREDFLQAFVWPLKGRISGEYGSRRVLNGTPKRPHYGLDIAAPEGTAVRAPADGLVTLNQPDLFYTGVTVMLDHGHGLSTLYIHMSKSSVELGQRVMQGDEIGKVGKTGRATGPHLHWGMSLFGTRLDPQLMLPN